MKVQSFLTVSSLVLASICVAQPVAQDLGVASSSNVNDGHRSKRDPLVGLIKLGALGVGLGAATKAFHHFGGYKHGGYYGGDHFGGGYGYGYKKPIYVEAYPVYGGHHGGYGHGGGFHEGYGHGYHHGGYGHGHPGGYVQGHPGGYGGDYGHGGSMASASASAYASSSSGGGSW